MPNILLVEDDAALSEGIALALRAQGTVRRCPTLAEAREALLLDRVWGDDFVEENALSVAVKRLRDKLHRWIGDIAHQTCTGRAGPQVDGRGGR